MTQYKHEQQNLTKLIVDAEHSTVVPPERKLSFLSNISALTTAAAISGIPADIIAFPFCRLKTMQMTQGADPSTCQFKGTFHAANYVYKTQGLVGFYRGLSPLLLSAVPGNTLFFMGAQLTQNTLGNNIASNVTSGLVGQTMGSLVWVPAEVFKELRQMELIKAELKTMTPVQLARYVYKREGLRGFYKGFIPQLLTFGPFHSIGLTLSNELHQRYAPKNTPILTSMIINGFSFGVAAAVTNPCDVIKTRAQVSAANPTFFSENIYIFARTAKVVKKEGATALFAGTGSRVAWLGTRQALAYTMFGKVYKACSDDFLSRQQPDPSVP